MVNANNEQPPAQEVHRLESVTLSLEGSATQPFDDGASDSFDHFVDDVIDIERAKPSLHQRGYVIQNTGRIRKSKLPCGDCDNASESEKTDLRRSGSEGSSPVVTSSIRVAETTAMYRDSRWHVVANVLFLLGSIFFLAGAIPVLVNFYKQEPGSGDDVVFTYGDDPEGGKVDKYMLIEGIGSMLMVPMAIIELVLSSHLDGAKVVNTLILGAAATGVTSTWLLLRDPFVSNLMSCISLHLWLVQGLYCFVIRVQGQNNPKEVFSGLSVYHWGLIADTLFLVVVISDVVLSYFYVFNFDLVHMAWVNLVNQMGWVVSATMYLMIAVYDHKQYRKYCLNLLHHEEKLNQLY